MFLLLTRRRSKFDLSVARTRRLRQRTRGWRPYRPCGFEPLENRRLLAASFELSSLRLENGGDGTVGFVLNGAPRPPDVVGYGWLGEHAGMQVAVGDVNGDGREDLAISAPYKFITDNSQYDGAVYVVFGRDAAFPAELELSSLNGSNGFVINGNPDDSSIGAALFGLSAGGDLNKDGFDDIVIPVWNSGKIYVVFGKAGPYSPTFELSSVDGANGFVVHGADLFACAPTETSTATVSATWSSA